MRNLNEPEQTRGQFAASQIKARPQMREIEIATLIDNQIARAVNEAIAELRQLVDAIARKAAQH